MHDAEGKRRGNPERAGGFTLPFDDSGLRLFEFDQGVCGAFGEDAAGLGRGEAAGRANKEPRPEFSLQAGDAAADHRLRYAEPPRRLRLARELDDAGEGEDVVEVAHSDVPFRSTVSSRPRGYRYRSINARLPQAINPQGDLRWP